MLLSSLWVSNEIEIKIIKHLMLVNHSWRLSYRVWVLRTSGIEWALRVTWLWKARNRTCFRYTTIQTVSACSWWFSSPVIQWLLWWHVHVSISRRYLYLSIWTWLLKITGSLLQRYLWVSQLLRSIIIMKRSNIGIHVIDGSPWCLWVLIILLVINILLRVIQLSSNTWCV